MSLGHGAHDDGAGFGNRPGEHLKLPVALLQRAEDLGSGSVWSPLAFLATETSRIKRGTGIMRLAARAPANAAMSAAALTRWPAAAAPSQAWVSGLQIVESRDGQAWGRPYYRVTDYVTIMRNMAEAGLIDRGASYSARDVRFRQGRWRR